MQRNEIRHFCLVLLFLIISTIILATTPSTKDIGGIDFQKHGCVAPSFLPSLSFISVVSKLQCATMCFPPLCVGVAIDNTISTAKQCALLAQEDLPPSSNHQCGVSGMTLTIFRDKNVQPTTTTPVAMTTNSPDCSNTNCICVFWVPGTCQCGHPCIIPYSFG